MNTTTFSEEVVLSMYRYSLTALYLSGVIGIHPQKFSKNLKLNDWHIFEIDSLNKEFKKYQK